MIKYIIKDPLLNWDEETVGWDYPNSNKIKEQILWKIYLNPPGRLTTPESKAVTAQNKLHKVYNETRLTNTDMSVSVEPFLKGIGKIIGDGWQMNY